MPLRIQMMVLVAATLLAGTFALAETNPPPPASASVTVPSDMQLIHQIYHPPFRLVAWTVAMLLGTPTILVAYGLAWRACRKKRPTVMHRKIILIATVLVFSTGLILLLLNLVEASSIPGAMAWGAAMQNLMAFQVAQGCHNFALSVAVSTVGIIAALTMPAERKATGSPVSP